jgi:endonuclease YncB( thermonuclease family)
MNEKLKQATLDNISIHTYAGLCTPGKMLTNYDGDTADIVFIDLDRLVRMRVRMQGYDAPEMHPSKHEPNREIVQSRAVTARNRLWELCAGPGVPRGQHHEHIIRVVCGSPDKYGRLLVTLFDGDININQTMIDEGHGYAYDGGTKHADVFERPLN